MNIRYFMLTCLAFANPANSQSLDDPGASLKAEALKKYAVRANSGDENKTVPQGVFYQVVLREAVQDKSAWGAFNQRDIEVLAGLHAPQSRFFVEQDMERIAALCRTLPGAPDSVTVMNLASEYANEVKQGERRVETYYRSEVGKLSLRAQSYIEARIEDLANSRQVGYGTIDIQGLAAEFPTVAYDLMKGKCTTQEAVRRNADLKDIYFMSEDINYSAVIEQ